MPRRNGPPPYRLHKATGQALVHVDGRDVYLGLHGSEESKRRYEEIVRQDRIERGRAEAKVDAERRVRSAADLTVVELVERYLRYAASYYVKNAAATSEFGNICSALRPLREHCQGMPAAAFGPLKLKDLREKLIEAGIVRKQINGRVDRIRRMFAWAVSEELLPPEVHVALRSVRGLAKGRSRAKEGQKVQPVDDCHVDAILRHLASRVRSMVELQRLTGMRSTELCIMRTIDLDMTGPVWVYTPESHKTEHHGHTRRIFLGPQAVEILRPWLRANRQEYLFQPREAEAERKEAMRLNRRTKVQPSQRDRSERSPRKRPGLRYTRDSYRQAITNGIAKANRARVRENLPPLSHWHPHQLRHSAGTRIRKEFGLDTVKAVLGHSSVVTSQIYADIDEAKAAEAMRRIG